MFRRCDWIFLFALLACSSVLASAPMRLSGLVLDAAGEPLQGARVELSPLPTNHGWMVSALAGRFSTEPVAVAITDEAGRFTLASPRPGVWTVLVQAPGFVPMRYAPLPLANDHELPSVGLARDVGARVQLAGEATAGVLVLAVSDSGSLRQPSTTDGWRVGARVGHSDPRGQISFQRAKNERLRIFALPPGSLEVATAEGGESTILALPSAGLSNRILEVRDGAGKPMADVVIAVGEMVLPAGRTDAEGRFIAAVSGLEQIDFHLLAADGRRARRASTGRSTGVWSLRLPAQTRALGQVTSAENHRPVAGALIWPPYDPGRFSVTEASGTFEVEGPTDPLFWLRVLAEGFMPLAQRIDRRSPARLRAVLTPARPAFGQVLDSAGGPLADSEVELVSVNGSSQVFEPIWILADDSGWFRTELTPVGRLDITVRKKGYAPTVVRGVTVAPGSQPADLGEIVLMPAVALIGNVHDAQGDAISDVGIWKISSLETQVDERRDPDASTGERGRFRIGDLEEGSKIDLLIHRSGYLPEQLRGVEVPTASPVTVVLEPASEVHGRVIDVQGAPLGQARVELREPDPPLGSVGVDRRRNEGAKSVTTDAAGLFVISDLSPGRGEIEASLDGYESAPPKRFEIPPGGIAHGMTLVLRRGATVEGQVTTRDGDGVSGVRISIGDQEESSNSAGYFRVVGVAPGRQMLVARHLEFERHEQEILVEPGENRAAVTLEAGWPASGRVMDLEGRPIVGASVSLRLDRASGEVRTYQVLSEAEGNFELPRVVNGLYDLQVEAAGYGAFYQAGVLRVRDQPPAELDIRLPLGARVVGQISGLEFEELASAHVEAIRSDRLRRQGFLDYEGSYEIEDLGPGAWLVRAQTDRGARQAEARVVIEEEQEHIVQDLDFHGLTLSGEVTHDGEPVPRSTVSLTGHELAVRREVTTDYLGHFRLTDLPPGRYRLGVMNGFHGLTYHEDLELTHDLERPIEITTTRLEGLVVSASEERPLSGAMIHVQQLLEANTTRPAALTTVSTDSHGAFTVARLAAGRYHLTVRKDGFTPAEQLVRLEPGTERQIRWVLEPARGLDLFLRLPADRRPIFAQVAVLDPSGRPVLSDTRSLDEEGHIRFPTVPAGTWQLVVSAPGLAVTRLTATVPGPPLELAPLAAARLELHIPFLVKQNMMAELSLRSADGSPFLGLGQDGTPRQRWNLQAGVGQIGGLPGGLWTLSVLAVDGQTWQETVTLSSGEQARVVLE